MAGLWLLKGDEETSASAVWMLDRLVSGKGFNEGAFSQTCPTLASRAMEFKRENYVKGTVIKCDVGHNSLSSLPLWANFNSHSYKVLIKYI